jgi:hypothetical protein
VHEQDAPKKALDAKDDGFATHPIEDIDFPGQAMQLGESFSSLHG